MARLRDCVFLTLPIATFSFIIFCRVEHLLETVQRGSMGDHYHLHSCMDHSIPRRTLRADILVAMSI